MQTLRVLDPRIKIVGDEEKNKIVYEGGNRVTYRVESANTYNQNQISWSFQPPSTNTIVDRAIYVRLKLKITNTQPFDFYMNPASVADAPAPWPIMTITDVLDGSINGEHFSTNVGDHVHAFLNYGNMQSDRTKNWSKTPDMPDQYQAYEDWATLGSTRNPLAPYGNSDAEMTRGGFPYDTLSTDGTEVTYIFDEPLLISPLLDGMSDDSGLLLINQFTFNLRLKTNKNMAWSHATNGSYPGGTITVTLDESYRPELLMNYITPDLIEPLPRLVSYEYFRPEEYVKPMGSLVPNQQVTIVSDNIRLNQIPQYIYIYAMVSRASQDETTPKTFLRIDNINVNWGNQSGLLATAQSQDLYNICVSNGYNRSYPQFTTYTGGVIKLHMGRDIGLLPNESAGVQGQYNFYVTVQFTNVSSKTQDYEFFVIPELVGSFEIAVNSARASLGNLLPENVLQAKEAEELPASQVQTVQGGSFLGKLRSSIHKVARGVQKASKFAAPIVGTLAPELAPGLESVSRLSQLASRTTGKRGRRPADSGVGMSSGVVGGRLPRRSLR